MPKNSRKMTVVDWLALPEDKKYIRGTNVCRYPLIRPYGIRNGVKDKHYFKEDGTMDRILLEQHRKIYEDQKKKRSAHRNHK